MRVPENLLKCVCFCAYETKSGDKHLNGTAFLAATQDDGMLRPYVITARHVIKAAEKKGIDGCVYLRMNSTEDSGDEDTCWRETVVNEWTFHVDDRIDVAVYALPDLLPMFDNMFVPLANCATEDVIREKNIGIGDQLFFPGLFVRHPGARRNEPIVRFGRIAGMPSTRMITSEGKATVYLAESRSIGGLSGSPVFVYIPTDRDDPKVPIGPGTPIPLGGGETRLLGMIHGHCGDAVKLDSRISDERVNMGIAVIVPISSILEVIRDLRPEQGSAG